jgi:VWFA-related protein
MSESAKPYTGSVRLAIAACFIAAGWLPAAGQPPAPSGAQNDEPEVTTREEKATFTSHVNLVMVPVVVRDKQGNVVAGLTKESFRLFDKGKLQEIDRFTVEKPGYVAAAAQPAAEQRPAIPGFPATAPSAAMPRRFLGYLFDDVHSETADLMRARDAAERHIESQLQPTDRAAILTTSGQGTADFTDDRKELRDTVARLVPRPIARAGGQQCPDISYYQADMIVNHDDPDSTNAAIPEWIICHGMDPADPRAVAQARIEVPVEARRVLSAGEQETQVSLAVLNDAVRRMSAMPGERVLVLASPGFLTLAEHQSEEYDVIERALRANVVINVLNLRGLYTTNVDAAHAILDSRAERTKQNLLRMSEMAEEGLLMEFAAGTGGYYFHNNNDLDEGFRRTATAPELYYLLGFQPQNLKMDGSFHGLKVALETKAGYAIEARRGYYAPTHLEDAAATAKREVEDAVYSREEMSDLPVTLHTQFFKGAADAASISVLAHVDLASAKFRKADGRNLDNITVVSALFDRNGNLVNGLVKHADFRLRDESLQYRLAHGITVRMVMDAKPGSYVVRLVVRDSEGGLMSALNGTVEIP